jgi:hypothetical protein
MRRRFMLELPPLLSIRTRAANGYAAACRANCASSVEPVKAVVDDCPWWMAWVTASKYPVPTSR